MKVTKELKIGIIGSIIASFLVIYLLEPFVSICGSTIVRISSAISSSYSNQLYTEIATGETNYAFMIWAILWIAIMFSLVIISVVFLIITSTKEVEKEKSEEEKKKIYRKEEKKRRSIIKAMRISSIFAIFISLFLLVWGIADDIVRISTIKNFNQKIKILTPYIGEKEKDILISEFSLMKSREDFEVLQNKIDSIGQKLGIELPESDIPIVY